MENSIENNSNFDSRLVIYLFLFLFLCFFVKSLLFFVPFYLLCFKLGEILRYFIMTKKLKKSSQSDLFIYTFTTLSLGFYSFLIYIETDLGLKLFSTICFWLSSLSYLFKLVSFKSDLACENATNID